MSLKMVLPKGRMNAKVMALLEDTGLRIQGSERNYRPRSNDPELDLKMLKSQNIPTLIALGQHDCGFAGLDWIEEQDARVTRVLDLGFDPVRLVACIPESWDWASLKERRIIAVSEYRNLCAAYLKSRELDFTFLHSFGATEVFPPEDADLIVDNTATGITLKENRLKIIDVLMSSTTHFIANHDAMSDPAKRERIENLALLFQAILAGRERVLLEMNCGEDNLDRLVALLPAMKAPTVAKLYRQPGFSVKAAVRASRVKDLIPELRKAGATDILESAIRKVVP